MNCFIHYRRISRFVCTVFAFIVGLLGTFLLLTGCLSPRLAPTPAPSAPAGPPATPIIATLPTASPQPAPVVKPAAIPFGVYAMMDWNRNAGAGEGKAHPWIKAGHYAFAWKQVNPSRGHFDWSLVDRWLEGEAGPRSAPTGKQVGLGVNAYDGEAADATPQWVLDAYPMWGYRNERKVTVAASEYQQEDARPALVVSVQKADGATQLVRLRQERLDGYRVIDTWIEAANPKVNHSTDASLSLGAAGQANLLFQFPIAGVPAGSKVISATLILTVLDAGRNNSDPLTVEAYALRKVWAPPQVTWVTARAGQDWTIRGANGVLAEADRDEKPAGSGIIQAAGPVQIALEPALIQSWLDNPSANMGLLIKQRRGDLPLPRYWDQGYLDVLAEMVNALAGRYGDDPRVAWVEISVGIYGETAPVNKAALKWSYAEAGLTSETTAPEKGLYSWVGVVKQIIDIYYAAFPTKPLFLQYSNNFESVSERAAYVPYAVEKGIGLKHNGLYPDSIDGATYGGPAVGTFNIMFTYSETVPVGWEFQVFPRTEPNVYWAMLNALDKHADFVMVQKEAITKTELIPIFELSNQYLGKTLENTPAAWVALRETERPAERWYTQMGNFSFYLYQNDNAPGGRTIPLWKVNDTKEGLFARRTDQASGNRYMYFDVDDRYHRGAGAVNVEVVYLDRGRDTWRLEYVAGGAIKAHAPVEKTDTGVWKRAKFTVVDATMAGGLDGFDFRIDCNADGDEIIHWVQLTALDRR